jgi:hypothetical protein
MEPIWAVSHIAGHLAVGFDSEFWAGLESIVLRRHRMKHDFDSLKENLTVTGYQDFADLGALLRGYRDLQR